MSSYANYEYISSYYDSGRKAVRGDIIAGMISKRKALKEVLLLDVGCGTGNYAKALLEYRVGSISLVDGCEGMLTKAKEKLSKSHLSSAVKDIKLTCLPNIPFGDNTFDAVMINQVLHHLEDTPNGIDFPVASRTVNEVQRVLKPEGSLIITTSSPEQVGGLWYINLIPDAKRKCQERCPNIQVVKDILQNNGLTTVNTLAYLGHDMFSEYDNVEGPLHESWRNMDSSWSLATEYEIQRCIEMIKEMRENGTLYQYFNDYDRSLLYGTFTIIEAQCKKKE